MHLDFTNKTAFITGGSNGIGYACASALASSGARLTIFDRETVTPDVASKIGATGIIGDVRDGQAVAGAMQQAAGSGGLDVVLINAGVVAPDKLLDANEEDWLRTIEVNLTAAWRTLRTAALMMKERRSGSIVVTASTNSFDGEGDLTAYNASKAGLLGLIRTAANELGPWNIRVNAVCPGLIRTRLTAAHYDNVSIMENYFRHIPLGRGGMPEEVAAAAAFLASDAASFITGTTLVVDGGQMATKFGPWTEELGYFEGDRWKLR